MRAQKKFAAKLFGRHLARRSKSLLEVDLDKAKAEEGEGRDTEKGDSNEF
jgi:hypothetical protein